MPTVSLSERDIDLIGRVVETEVPHSLQRTNPDEYERMVAAVVDTITNRVATGRYGATVEDVLNEHRAFSKITGPASLEPYGSVAAAPRASSRVQSLVNERIGAALRGVPSLIAGAVNYANPFFSSPNNLRGWVQPMIDAGARRLGVGNAVHYHGNAPGVAPAGEYNFAAPEGFMDPVDWSLDRRGLTPTPTSRPQPNEVQGYIDALPGLTGAGILGIGGRQGTYSAPSGTVERGVLGPAYESRRAGTPTEHGYRQAGMTMGMAGIGGLDGRIQDQTFTAPVDPVQRELLGDAMNNATGRAPDTRATDPTGTYGNSGNGPSGFGGGFGTGGNDRAGSPSAAGSAGTYGGREGLAGPAGMSFGGPTGSPYSSTAPSVSQAPSASRNSTTAPSAPTGTANLGVSRGPTGPGLAPSVQSPAPSVVDPYAAFEARRGMAFASLPAPQLTPTALPTPTRVAPVIAQPRVAQVVQQPRIAPVQVQQQRQAPAPQQRQAPALPAVANQLNSMVNGGGFVAGFGGRAIDSVLAGDAGVGGMAFSRSNPSVGYIDRGNGVISKVNTEYGTVENINIGPQGSLFGPGGLFGGRSASIGGRGENSDSGGGGGGGGSGGFGGYGYGGSAFDTNSADRPSLW